MSETSTPVLMATIDGTPIYRKVDGENEIVGFKVAATSADGEFLTSRSYLTATTLDEAQDKLGEIIAEQFGIAYIPKFVSNEDGSLTLQVWDAEDEQ